MCALTRVNFLDYVADGAMSCVGRVTLQFLLCLNRICSPVVSPIYNFCGKFKFAWIRIPPLGVLIFILWIYQCMLLTVTTRSPSSLVD